jgi:ERCC4-related helicase
MFDNLPKNYIINFDAPIWNEIVANHRHNNVSILIASQSMTNLPVYVRDYSNFAVIFYQTTPTHLRQILRTSRTTEFEAVPGKGSRKNC